MRVGRRVDVLSFLVEVDGSVVAGVVALVILILRAVVQQVIEDDLLDVLVEGDLALQADDARSFLLEILEPRFKLPLEDISDLILDLLVQRIIADILKILLPFVLVLLQEPIVSTEEGQPSPDGLFLLLELQFLEDVLPEQVDVVHLAGVVDFVLVEESHDFGELLIEEGIVELLSVQVLAH